MKLINKKGLLKSCFLLREQEQTGETRKNLILMHRKIRDVAEQKSLTCWEGVLPRYRESFCRGWKCFQIFYKKYETKTSGEVHPLKLKASSIMGISKISECRTFIFSAGLEMKETGARSPSAVGSVPKVLAATGHEVLWLHLCSLANSSALPPGRVPGEAFIT